MLHLYVGLIFQIILARSIRPVKRLLALCLFYIQHYLSNVNIIQ